jgi:hypothetical protein
MKTKILSVICTIGFMSLTAASPRKLGNPVHAKPNAKCLALSCSASSEGEPLKGVTLKLYKGSRLVSKIPATGIHPASFLLEQNTGYILYYSKPGYLDRIIQINTSLPENVSPDPLFLFDVEMDMLTLEMESTVSDFPAGIISYDQETEKFERSEVYSQGIRKLKKELELTSSVAGDQNQKRK